MNDSVFQMFAKINAENAVASTPVPEVPYKQLVADNKGKTKLVIQYNHIAIYPIVGGKQQPGSVIHCPELDALRKHAGADLELWLQDATAGDVKLATTAKPAAPAGKTAPRDSVDEADFNRP